MLLEGEAATAAFRSGTLPHHRGTSNLLATLTLLGGKPRRVVLLGVQPAVLALVLRLSPTVEARVGDLCAEVVVELSTLGLSPPGALDLRRERGDER